MSRIKMAFIQLLTFQMGTNSNNMNPFSHFVFPAQNNRSLLVHLFTVGHYGVAFVIVW